MSKVEEKYSEILFKTDPDSNILQDHNYSTVTILLEQNESNLKNSPTFEEIGKKEEFYEMIQEEPAMSAIITEPTKIIVETISECQMKLNNIYDSEISNNSELSSLVEESTYENHTYDDEAIPKLQEILKQPQYIIDIFSEDDSIDIPGAEILTYEPESDQEQEQEEQPEPLTFQETSETISYNRKSKRATTSISEKVASSVVGEEMLKMIKDIRGKHIRRDDISAFALNLEDLIRQANFTIAERVDVQIKILNLVQEFINKKMQI